MAQLAIDRSTVAGRGSLIQRLRLISGLVLMVFAIGHFANHILGNFSLEAMQAAQVWRVWLWENLPAQILLYGSLVIHVALTSWKFIQRRTFKLPAWEWAQIVLGAAIPYWLAVHIVATRMTERRLGIPVDYALELTLLWPGAAITQTALLFIVWAHGCIGIHFWLRLRPWYERWFTAFAAAAFAVPLLATTGWISAARQLRAAALAAPDAVSQPGEAPTPAEYMEVASFVIQEMTAPAIASQQAVIAFAIAVALALGLRQIVTRLHKRIRVDYGDGQLITTSPGNTLLEISRQAGIPHMSVCGGRARCSTCRTLILDGDDALTQPTEAETNLLSKLNADADIRLACQARARGNVSIRPLVQPQQQAVTIRAGDPLGWGVERKIAVLFLDIRGFSRISERSLPYDVVFILNSFFGEAATAVETHNGYVDKFMGDGMMALFGLDSSEVEASRDAIRAAIECDTATSRVSRILTQHLDEPIRIGVGVHVGDAVVGRIGRTSDQRQPSRLTAIGDSVNIASRLEQATKELGTSLVISEQTMAAAGITEAARFGDRSSITVRNISKPIDIVAIRDPAALEEALADQTPAGKAAKKKSAWAKRAAAGEKSSKPRAGKRGATRN